MLNASEMWRTSAMDELSIEELLEELRDADRHANIYASCTDGSFECAREMGGFNALVEECDRREIDWREELGYNVRN